MENTKYYTLTSLQWHSPLTAEEQAEKGKLYANGLTPTTLSAEDLPKHFVGVKINDVWGYLSAQNISSLIYIPDLDAGQDGRNDTLYICYDGFIVTVSGKWIRSDYRFPGDRQIKRFIAAVVKHSPKLDMRKILRQISAVEAWRDMECPEPDHFKLLFYDL